MFLFMYMIYVIYSISQLKKEDKRVSLITKIVVYSLLVLSLVKIYFGLVAFIFSPFTTNWFYSFFCSWRYETRS